jgi:pyridoxal/pyridoxine/pyridoxamine kinase
MKVLSISSQVVWGPVGNSAAVPALQAKGHEVLALPTITLSNHPGHGAPAGFRTQAEDMARMFAALEALGALHNLDAMLTGYFASVGQVEEVAGLLGRVAVPYLLVDPVMGDAGKGLFIPPDVAQAIQDELDVYNPLIPEPAQLCATLFLELTSDEQMREWLPKLVGIERSLVFRLPDGSEVRCEVEAAHASQLTREHVTAAVHFVDFRFTAAQVASFVDGVVLAVDHPEYLEAVELAPVTVAELRMDLVETV